MAINMLSTLLAGISCSAWFSGNCLVAIVGTELKINRSTYEILQVLGISLLDKTPVVELFTVIDYKDVKEQFSNQLSLNLF